MAAFQLATDLMQCLEEDTVRENREAAQKRRGASGKPASCQENNKKQLEESSVNKGLSRAQKAPSQETKIKKKNPKTQCSWKESLY